MEITLRTMLPSDLPSMLDLQIVCFPELEPESEACLKAKLMASPNTCFVAEKNGQLMGYLITHPWTSQMPPELDAPNCNIPDTADCLYIHDLSVHPEARGTGTAQALLDQFNKCTDQFQYKLSALIAVQNSKGFWMKHGYEVTQPNESIQKKLNSYGDNAHYMLKQL